jgi:hypothetical protein
MGGDCVSEAGGVLTYTRHVGEHAPKHRHIHRFLAVQQGLGFTDDFSGKTGLGLFLGYFGIWGWCGSQLIPILVNQLGNCL